MRTDLSRKYDCVLCMDSILAGLMLVPAARTGGVYTTVAQDAKAVIRDPA